MAEELKPIGGGEVRPEEAILDGERSVETVPAGQVERAPENAPESQGERHAETPVATPTVPLPTTPIDDGQIEIDAKAVYDETDAEARVTKLVSLAEVNGVEHAVRVARKLNDFYVLDRMHDELSGKFYDALKAKGMISE